MTGNLFSLSNPSFFSLSFLYQTAPVGCADFCSPCGTVRAGCCEETKVPCCLRTCPERLLGNGMAAQTTSGANKQDARKSSGSGTEEEYEAGTQKRGSCTTLEIVCWTVFKIQALNGSHF